MKNNERDARLQPSERRYLVLHYSLYKETGDLFKE